MDLTIQRSRWLRGGKEFSVLLNYDGKMCCLGFLSIACGLSESDILNKVTPATVESNRDKFPAWIIRYSAGKRSNSQHISAMMEVNDYPGEIYPDGFSEDEREKKLFGLFGEHGIRVTFVE